MKRVVVTGASGFIGRESITPLLARGFDVHTLGRSEVRGATHHACDILLDDPSPILLSIAPTHLLHFAWNTEPGRFWAAPDNLDWLAGSLRLARGFVAAGGQRAAFAGSCAEYDWSHEVLDESETPLNPATLYGTAKLALYQTLKAARKTTGLSYVWGRVFFPYGPSEKSERLLPTVIDGLAEGRRVECSEGRQRRDFLHVEDVSRAFVRLLDGEIEGAVNIASGQSTTVRDFVLKAAAYAGDMSLVSFGGRTLQEGEPAVMNAAVDLLYGTGFRPRYTLDSGLYDAVNRRLSARLTNSNRQH